MDVGRIFSKEGGNSAFFQVVAKSIFPGGDQQWWNFILPTQNQERNM